jgi:cytochrome c-type biogenesis protein CcmF
MNSGDLFGISGFIGLSSAFMTCGLIILCALLFLFLRKHIILQVIEILTYFQAVCFFLALSSLGVLLQINAFEYPLVFDAVESGMNWFQKLGGLWAGQSSSLLFWSTVMSCGACLSISMAKKMTLLEYRPSVAAILQFMLVFFIVPILFINNPFNKLWAQPGTGFTEAVFAPEGSSLIVPADGLGINPSLRHIAMLLHPPFLYLGLIGFFIPYAFALASLMIQDRESDWIRLNFPIAAGAWTCLTIGMFLGSWWAYTILGWGGYWGWDPVEISGLLPWILSFGLVHSMYAYLNNRAHRKWVYALSLLIVILILFGILLTRTGLIESVHAYSAGTMGPVLTALIGINILTVALLAVKSWNWIKEKKENKNASVADNLIKAFNIVLLLLTAFYLFGQTLPVTSRFFLAESKSLTAEQYELYSAPLLLSLVIITALFPYTRLWTTDRKKMYQMLAAAAISGLMVPIIIRSRWPIDPLIMLAFWVVTFMLISWLFAFWRILANRVERKSKITPGWLGHLASVCIHIGFAIMAIGILGAENLAYHTEIRIGENEALVINDYKITTGVIRETWKHIGQTDYELNTVILENGREILLTTTLEYFPKREMLHAKPSIHASVLRDIQIVMTQLPGTLDQKAILQLYVFPLMSWIWAGGALMALGGFFQLIHFTKNHLERPAN